MARLDEEVQAGLDAGIAIEHYRPYGRGRLRLLRSADARRSLRASLARIRPDVLHAHYLTRYGWLARLSGFHPYAITVWGSDILVTAPASLRARIWARLALGGADLVTADSSDLARAAIRAGARPERVRLVQFGVETERFSPAPPPERLRQDLALAGQRVVFSPRSIKPVYRQDIVVDAVARLPEDVSLIMTSASADAGELAAIESRLGALGLTARVRIVAPIPHDDMPGYYRLADVVVSVPTSDGTPVSLLEAMACGRPIVATDVPSVREWLGPLAPDALVRIGDAAGTAEAIRSMLSSGPERRAELGAAFRGVIVERADHEKHMLAVEDMYRSLVREGVAGRR